MYTDGVAKEVLSEEPLFEMYPMGKTWPYDFQKDNIPCTEGVKCRSAREELA